MNARSALLLAAACLLLAPLASCGPAQASPAPRGLPPTLADTGLYADFEARTLAPDVLAYEPQYPLWTDGATKRRWIALPPGTRIDASDPDFWVFPAGTRLWKEFALGGPVETRYLEKLPDGSWLRASYAWSADGREAPLAPPEGVRGAARSATGAPYDIPSRADCATCHARGDGVLGFGALQLSPDRDPLAPHAAPPTPGALDLPALAGRGLLRGLPDELLRRAPRIAARTPRERAALGYLHVHCGSCHWGGGLLAGLDLTLDARVGDGADPHRALATTLGHASRFRPPGAPERVDQRLWPGEPERSALFFRTTTREPLAQMPPVGTHALDTEATALLEAWIREDLAARPETPSEPRTNL